jgi:predicted phage-related endonuclease
MGREAVTDMVTMTRQRVVKRGDLITPTGRLVLYPDELGGEQWLAARRWRHPKDVAPDRTGQMDLAMTADHPFYPLGYRIGSSDVPSILDLEGVDTPAHVYRAKVYDIRPEPNEAMNWGHLLEAPIALEWCRRNRAVIDEIGLVAKDDEPWRQSTIDRRVRECPVYRREGIAEECLLEVKNVGFASAARWHREIPDRILAQLIDQLDVTGYSHAHYACLVGGNVMKQGIVYADRETELRDYLRTEVRRFRTEHLLAGREPEWNVSEKPDKMIELDEATHPERDGTLDIEGIGEVMEYARLARRKADAETARKAAAARLRQLADGREILTFAGQSAVRFGPTHRTNVDLDKLKEKYPDAYADPEVVSETTSHTIYIDKAYKVKKGDE